MSEFIKKHDLLNKILALALAIILWAVVVNIKNPIITVSYQDILVNYISLDMVDDDYELVIISDEYPLADIKIRGIRTEIAQVNEANIEITCDLAHIKEPGVYEVLYNVKLPFSDMEVINKSPDYLTVEIDYIQTRTIPVEVELLGLPALNYSYQTVIAEPDIVISGPSTEVSRISNAYISIDVDGKFSDIEELAEVYLIDYEENIVVSENIKQSDYMLSVEMPVYKTLSVPIDVDLVFGDVVSEKAINGYTISPTRVYIIGRPMYISEITSINLGELEIDDTQYGKSEFVFALPYIENINYTTQTGNSATVTILFTDYLVQEMEITNFAYDSEEYHEFEIVDEAIIIELAGSKAEFEKLLLGDIYIELEIDPEEIEKMRNSDGVLPNGTYEFVGIVQNSSVYEFDVIGEYIVTVEVTNGE
ncbi:MAG: hypothetical protein R3Y12_02605 [Clostridia bacterium]